MLISANFSLRWKKWSFSAQTELLTITKTPKKGISFDRKLPILKLMNGYTKERRVLVALTVYWDTEFWSPVFVRWDFSCVRSVAAAELQHFECELFEHNQKYFTLISNSHLFFHSNLRSRTHSGRRVSDCFGVCVSVQTLECCVHDRLFFPHSVGREEWAAMELRTLIPFTTVVVKHWVCAKCCWALLLWKGPLSRASFQVSAERDTTESHGQWVSELVSERVRVSVCVPVCVGQLV